MECGHSFLNKKTLGVNKVGRNSQCLIKNKLSYRYSGIGTKLSGSWLLLVMGINDDITQYSVLNMSMMLVLRMLETR